MSGDTLHEDFAQGLVDRQVVVMLDGDIATCL